MLDYRAFISDNNSERCDKILWHCRLYKTRNHAQKAISNGDIKINNILVHKTRQPIKIGDVVTINRGHHGAQLYKILLIPKARLNPKICAYFIDIV